MSAASGSSGCRCDQSTGLSRARRAPDPRGRGDNPAMAVPPPSNQSDHEVLAGIVKRATFRNADNGFCALFAERASSATPAIVRNLQFRYEPPKGIRAFQVAGLWLGSRRSEPPLEGLTGSPGSLCQWSVYSLLLDRRLPRHGNSSHQWHGQSHRLRGPLLLNGGPSECSRISRC
jgi:hypothetical protein